MAIKLTFHTHKGGTGKTMLCYNTSTYLASLGYKVLCIDLDAQGSLTDILMHEWQMKYDVSLTKREVYWSCDNILTLEGTATKDLFERIVPKEEIKIMKATHGLDLIYMRPNDFSANGIMTDKQGIANFISQIPSITEGYDFVFFDFPPTATLYVLTILTKLDFFVIPQTVAANISATAGEITVLKGLGVADKILGIVLNRVVRGAKSHKNAEQQLREADGIDLFNHTIHNSVSIDTSIAYNTMLNKLSGGINAYNEIRNITEEMLERIYVKQAIQLHHQTFTGTEAEKQRVIEFVKKKMQKGAN